MDHEAEQAALLAQGIELVKQCAERNGPAALHDLINCMQAQEAADRETRRLALRHALGKEATE